MKLSFPVRLQARHGFTLVELLVAMGVLMAVSVMVSTLISGVTRTTQLGERSMESDSISRTFFNRLSLDLGNMVRRADINYGFVKDSSGSGGTDDRLLFYAFQENPAGSFRPLSLICYDLRSPNGTAFPEMLRAAYNPNTVPPNGTGTPQWYAGVFVERGNVVLNSDISPTLTTSIGTDATGASFDLSDDFQSFGREIIRFEFNFLLENSAGNIVYADRLESDTTIQKIKGIVVAIAVLNPKSASRLTDADLTNLAQSMIDVTSSSSVVGDATATSPLSKMTAVWRDNLNTFAASASNPHLVSAAHDVRLYQRTFLFQ